MIPTCIAVSSLKHVGDCELLESSRLIRDAGMPNDDQIAYYRLREATERLLAANAPSEGVARIHTELADRYAKIIVRRSEDPHPS